MASLHDVFQDSEVRRSVKSLVAVGVILLVLLVAWPGVAQYRYDRCMHDQMWNAPQGVPVPQQLSDDASCHQEFPETPPWFDPGRP